MLLTGAATVLFAVAPNFVAVAVAHFFQGLAAAATWIAGLAFIAERYSGTAGGDMGYITP